VRGAKGGSRKAIPFRVVPERGQSCEYLSEQFSVVENKEVCNVLHEHIAGSNVANDSVHLSPKHSLRVPESFPLAGARDALTGEAAGDEVDRLGVTADDPHVVVDASSGPALRENVAAELVTLGKPGVAEAGEGESPVHEPGS
jgi:hypothetical protein